MQLFIAEATKFLIYFAHENMKKLASKVAHNQPTFFFSNANQPKSSPNLNCCSIKNIPPWDFSIMTLPLNIQGTNDLTIHYETSKNRDDTINRKNVCETVY